MESNEEGQRRVSGDGLFKLRAYINGSADGQHTAGALWPGRSPAPGLTQSCHLDVPAPLKITGPLAARGEPVAQKPRLSCPGASVS